MKLRLFEVPAARGLLLTEYHEAIESFYEVDKEIITFKTYDEFIKKTSFLLKNPKVVEQIAQNGYNRFIKEHESKIRLSNILEKIVQC